MDFFKFFLVIAGYATLVVCDEDGLSVCLPKLGCMQGTHMPGYQTDKFQAFMGIPFAKPPVGNLRLANPVPNGSWEGTLDATQPKTMCIQKNYLLPDPSVQGDEDCLYLNVYRPIVAHSSPLPVMVFLHGGGYFAGSPHPGLMGPEYFMDTREVILVTVAYRLGALGFLSTGDKNCPGNFGLKDQALALKWVQQNIASFNGNPNSVTLFGQSAGGASAHMHMMSPLSESLFHRAIVMSGNAAAPYNAVIRNPLEQARKQVKYIGIENAETMTSSQIMRELRQVDVKKLINAGDGFKYWQIDPLTVFRPVIEKKHPSAFLLGDPIEMAANGNYQHVPWLTGVVPDEGAVRTLSIISNDNFTASFNADFDELLWKMMEIKTKSKAAKQEKLNRIVQFYLNGEHKITKENSRKFGQIVTDRAFSHPLYKGLLHYTKYADLTKNPVAVYRFEYKGPYSYSAVYTGTPVNYGVVHCDDLIYLFKSKLLFPEFDRSSMEAKVISSLVDTYVAYAKNGDTEKWVKLKPCTESRFVKNSDTICDYQEFTNTSSGELLIKANNYFNYDVIRFWDELLE